ncbi:hypothetical protein GLYMA_04G160500v4 [Glycine max]|uniref:uncharacterized protein n=1 Tax=Glycine max TaxID=3847 RepID=UPI0003DE90D5|nr:uncharacterized protein LOC100786330 [Glycine max]KAG4392526.1 hypothetical protein GLYMA_04G160500v4 [Glycine max]KAH1111606.1 hypothetical protein GYH30_010119 [Glycine max]|eukprot:XP_003522987.2 uncharacterized protein LOC100786330 [Glycine max]
MHLISSEKNSIEQLVIALSAESCASVALVVQESIHLVNGKNIQVTERKKWKHSVKVKSTTTNGKMGQDDHLLESLGSIQFLMKLLKPIVSTTKFGYKLLSLRQNDDMLKNTTMTGRLDSSSAEVFSRVQEILVNCKELKTCQNDSRGRDQSYAKMVSIADYGKGLFVCHFS